MKAPNRVIAASANWSGMAELYASNRTTFQEFYAADFWQQMLNRSCVKEVVHRSKSILDFGCGTGDYTSRLASKFTNTVGVDISKNMIEHARHIYPKIRFEVADFTQDSSIFSDKEFDLIFSTMVLHWPGPNPQLLEALFRLLKPGGVLIAGLHGAKSCQEGVDAIEQVASETKNWNLVLDDLPTMFKRDSSAMWHSALSDTGFVHLNVADRTLVTPYFTHTDCTKRLCAAWPPILTQSYLDSSEIPDFMQLAATAMIDNYKKSKRNNDSSDDSSEHIFFPSKSTFDNDKKVPVAVMTSHLIEFSAHKPQ